MPLGELVRTCLLAGICLPVRSESVRKPEFLYGSLRGAICSHGGILLRLCGC